jgi:hypothetical protein
MIAARPYDEYTSDLVHLLQELFPECDVQVKYAEAEIPVDSPLSPWSPVSLD